MTFVTDLGVNADSEFAIGRAKTKAFDILLPNIIEYVAAFPVSVLEIF